ncbi:MAG: hypothetical protein [Caudoviricetes sp.]|nr:MAG: hypothetical protein [Caudoviricetes sp.]
MSNPTFKEFIQVANDQGVYLHGVSKLAMDADPQPQLAANGGIPAIVSTFIDPTIINTLFTPNKAADILGREEKRGAWAQDSFLIQRIEETGDTVAYDDYSNQGGVQVTSDWEQRQVYRYQTMVTYGELEQERYGLAMLPYAAKKQQAAINVLNQDQNKFYLYGVDGLKNYGLLNDPALPTPITPATVDSNVLWKNKAVIDIYNDILAMYEDLVSRTNGIIGDGIDVAAPLTLAMSPQLSVYVKKANEIVGNTVEKMLKDTFPNLRIETAPQYSTTAGELVQLFANEAQGQEVGFMAYSEKLRSHPLVTDVSSYKQKYSGTTYGAVITQPMLFAQLLGA